MTKLKLKYKPKTTSVFDFLEEYYDRRCPATYFEDNTLQCKPEAGRSLGDLTMLTKSYIENATEGQVAKTMIKLCRMSKSTCTPCGNIQTLAFHSKIVKPRYNTAFDGRGVKSWWKNSPYQMESNFKGKGISVKELIKIAKNA